MADLIIHVVDDTCLVDQDVDEMDFPGERNLIVKVHNKIDQSGRTAGVITSQDGITRVGVSAKTGEGLQSLTSVIETILLGEGHQTSQFSARQRHVEALTVANEHLTNALSAYSLHNAAELLSEDLKLVQNAIDSLTGKVSSDDILGQIFSSFCIGKITVYSHLATTF